MMDDYISREAAVEQCKRHSDYTAWSIKDGIEAIPAADVEPVRHGRWIHEETEGGFHIWSCSRCGSGMNGNPKGTNLYCYHCGAKMDLEDENNENFSR